MNHWLDYWDYLDRNFWAYCRWFGRELTPQQLAWQPTQEVGSIGWNLRHLGEMLDHYLTGVFRAQPRTVSSDPLVTMFEGSRDDGRFGDLAAIEAYHRQLQPGYRRFLAALAPQDMATPCWLRRCTPPLA